MSIIYLCSKTTRHLHNIQTYLSPIKSSHCICDRETLIQASAITKTFPTQSLQKDFSQLTSIYATQKICNYFFSLCKLQDVSCVIVVLVHSINSFFTHNHFAFNHFAFNHFSYSFALAHNMHFIQGSSIYYDTEGRGGWESGKALQNTKKSDKSYVDDPLHTMKCQPIISQFI